MMFTKLLRQDVDSGVIFVSTNSLFQLNVKRNDLVQVKNLDNGSVVFLEIRGARGLIKGEVGVSYDTAVTLRIDTIRETFRNSNIKKEANVNLVIKKPNVLRFMLESVRTGTKISRWLAFMGIAGGIDLSLSMIDRFIKLLTVLVQFLTSQL